MATLGQKTLYWELTVEKLDVIQVWYVATTIIVREQSS